MRGEMSLAGPLPERPKVVTEFAERNPMLRAREAVKPPITGLAQVLGRYDTDRHSELRFDLLDMTRWGPGLDLLILFWTIPAMPFSRTVGRVAVVMDSAILRRWASSVTGVSID